MRTRLLAMTSAFSSFSSNANPALSSCIGRPAMLPEQSSTSANGVRCSVLSTSATSGIPFDVMKIL